MVWVRTSWWIMKKFLWYLWSRLFGDVCARSRCVEILKKAGKFVETCFSPTINMSTLNHPQLINIRVDIHTWHCHSFWGPDVEVRVKPVQTWHHCQNRTSCNMFHSFLAGHSLSPFVIPTDCPRPYTIQAGKPFCTSQKSMAWGSDSFWKYVWVLNKFGGWQIGKLGNNNQLLYVGGFNLSSQKRIENNKRVWTNDRKEKFWKNAESCENRMVHRRYPLYISLISLIIFICPYCSRFPAFQQLVWNIYI